MRALNLAGQGDEGGSVFPRGQKVGTPSIPGHPAGNVSSATPYRVGAGILHSAEIIARSETWDLSIISLSTPMLPCTDWTSVNTATVMGRQQTKLL